MHAPTIPTYRFESDPTTPDPHPTQPIARELRAKAWSLPKKSNQREKPMVTFNVVKMLLGSVLLSYITRISSSTAGARTLKMAKITMLAARLNVNAAWKTALICALAHRSSSASSPSAAH